jgi:arylsulfatase
VPDHVLVVLVDTLRADHLGCYGHPSAETPAMDSIAATGVRFERAISQCSWTAPSVVSLMTSRYMAEERLDVPEGIPTLARSFQEDGWATAGFIMNDIVKEEAGFRQGFGPFHQMIPYDPLDRVKTWIVANARIRSFTYVHLNEPHDPYLPPEPHQRKVLAPDPVSADRRSFYDTVHGGLDLQDDLGTSVAHIEREVGGYIDDIGFSDKRIQELLDVYEQTGLLERTCVVITSDHGEGLWTRVAYMTGQRGQKLAEGDPTLVNTLMPTHGNQVNHELVNVPLLIRSPGLKAGTVVTGTVELVDVFPTLLELCDLEVPSGLQGHSLVERVGRGHSDAAGFTYTRFNSSLVTADGWQLILPTELGECAEGVALQLYDLKTDPDARHNLAAEHPERVRELSAIVAARLADGLTGATTPSARTVAQLAKLGYGPSGAGIFTQVREELLAKSTAELIDILTASNNCLARLEAARALGERELTESETGVVRTRMGLEGAEPVREAMDAALRD